MTLNMFKVPSVFFQTFILSLVFVSTSVAQHVIYGVVTDKNDSTLSDVHIVLEGVGITVTNSDGVFNFNVSKPDKYILKLSHTQYEPLNKEVSIGNDSLSINLKLKIRVTQLDDVEVQGRRDREINDEISTFNIRSKSIQYSPVPFNEISNILSSLPSVASNNELSTTYSVRGGSYNENLVYVNGISVYRPYLIRAGQQEGLSFINTDLINELNFSAGGWQPKYGDKLSSVLNTYYRKPDGFHGSVSLSMLGAKGHLEGEIGEVGSYIVGARHKRSQYLLNTLDVEGQYKPKFTDVQGFFNFKLNEEHQTNLGLLLYYAGNRYEVIPESGETDFGTFNRELRLNVGFVGAEKMFFDTYQAGLTFDHNFNANWNLKISSSYVKSFESEFVDLEGGYRLCDIDKNLSSETFNQCATIRGIGTIYNYSRNQLEANILNANVSSTLVLNSKQFIEVGLGYINEEFDDYINEYSFVDSADYVTINESILAAQNTNAHHINGYAQHVAEFDNVQLSYGVRFDYNTLNKKSIVSPRSQLLITPQWQKDVVFKLGAGIYQQQPLYREYRDAAADIETDIPAQSSWHFIGGLQYRFKWWSRNFELNTEAYYKYYWNIVPYTVDNVRIRYYPEYTATGYAAGFEVRLGGEFVPGTESWFSLGLLDTKEQIDEIDNKMIRRPMDQRVKVAMLFEDHFPNDPTMRVNLNLQYGSGLPFGSPGDIELRNAFRGDDYVRVDIGFSKTFNFQNKSIEHFRIGAEVINLIGSRNAITYTWIKDFSSNQYAVPNYLSNRLFNVVLSTGF